MKALNRHRIYQYARADFAQAHKVAQQIRDTGNPYMAKKLGKSVNCQAWGPRRDEVLQRLMKVKFQQNKELQQTLLETRQAKLVECTIDPYWGAGCGLESRQLDNGEYKGQNIVGVFLEEIRAELRASQQPRAQQQQQSQQQTGSAAANMAAATPT